VHGKNHPELERLQVAFSGLANELGAHLIKEEQVLFSYVKQMASGSGCGPSCFPYLGIRHPFHSPTAPP